jgi:hypothetical protein
VDVSGRNLVSLLDVYTPQTSHPAIPLTTLHLKAEMGLGLAAGNFDKAIAADEADPFRLGARPSPLLTIRAQRPHLRIGGALRCRCRRRRRPPVQGRRCRRLCCCTRVVAVEILATNTLISLHLSRSSRAFSKSPCGV